MTRTLARFLHWLGLTGPPRLPPIDRRQALVLGLLQDGEMSDRELQAKLREAGERMTGPAFYMMMARMEDAGWVEGWWVAWEIDGQAVRGRRYRITRDGGGARREWEEFAERQAARRGWLDGLAGT